MSLYYRCYGISYFSCWLICLLTLGPPITHHMQTIWIRMRRREIRHLTQIKAVWHPNNIFTSFEQPWCTNFEQHWSSLKIEADEKHSRRLFIWWAKGEMTTCVKRYFLRLLFGVLLARLYCIGRALDKMHISISVMLISSPNPMVDHMLEWSHWDHYNKWSNIEFGEEIIQA